MTQTAKEKRKDKYWLLRWGLSMLLVVWAFILGVLVGQGSLANDQQLESLRKLSLSWFGISFYQEEQSAQDPLLDPDLSFYEQLASRPANNSSQPAAPLPAAQPVPATQPAAVPPPDDTEGQPAATHPADTTEQSPSSATASPQPPPSASQAASPAPLNQVRPYQPDTPVGRPGHNAGAARPVVQSAAIPSGRFTVQVGSFQDERQALELSNRLRRGGFAAYVSRINIDGVGLRLRVRVGGYDSLEQAQNVAASLRSKENIAAYVTRND